MPLLVDLESSLFVAIRSGAIRAAANESSSIPAREGNRSFFCTPRRCTEQPVMMREHRPFCKLLKPVRMRAIFERYPAARFHGDLKPIEGLVLT
jgi:hypothetical protein